MLISSGDGRRGSSVVSRSFLQLPSSTEGLVKLDVVCHFGVPGGCQAQLGGEVILLNDQNLKKRRNAALEAHVCKIRSLFVRVSLLFSLYPILPRLIVSDQTV